MIDQILKKLGLNDKEIRVYLTILEYGKILPARVAQITKINRTTVYATAKELLKKGVITEDIGEKSTYYVALPPEDLNQLITKEKSKLKEKEKLIKEAILELEILPKAKTYSIPKIRFIDEIDVKDFLYKQTPIWIESMKKTNSTWWGFQDHTFVEQHQEWIDWLWKYAPQEIDLKLITNSSKIEREMTKKKIARRNIRFWKKDFKFTASQWIIGDYLIMIVTRQKPHYLVEIHDPVFAENMRELFRNLWEEI